MTIEQVKNLVHTVIESLQIPDSMYKIITNETASTIEIQLTSNDSLFYDLVIGSDSLHVLYNTKFDSDALYTETFNSSIRLLYVFSTILYVAISKDEAPFSYYDMMGFILNDSIYDWQSLTVALCNEVGLICSIIDSDTLQIAGQPVTFNSSTLKYKDLKFDIDPESFSAQVELCYSIVDYIASLHDLQDDCLTESKTESSEDDSSEQSEDDSKEPSSQPSEPDENENPELQNKFNLPPEETQPEEPEENV